MVHVSKPAEDDMNYFHVLLIAPYMVFNPKEVIYHYLYQNRTGTWDKGKNVKMFWIQL